MKGPGGSGVKNQHRQPGGAPGLEFWKTITEAKKG